MDKQAAARKAFRSAVESLARRFPGTDENELASMLQRNARGMSAKEAVKATVEQLSARPSYLGSEATTSVQASAQMTSSNSPVVKGTASRAAFRSAVENLHSRFPAKSKEEIATKLRELAVSSGAKQAVKDTARWLRGAMLGTRGQVDTAASPSAERSLKPANTGPAAAVAPAAHVENLHHEPAQNMNQNAPTEATVGGSYDPAPQTVQNGVQSTPVPLPKLGVEHGSLAAEALRSAPGQSAWLSLSRTQTPAGFTLTAAIKPALELPGLMIGAVAGDEASWITFWPFYRIIVEAYHSYAPFPSVPADAEAHATSTLAMPSQACAATGNSSPALSPATPVLPPMCEPRQVSASGAPAFVLTDGSRPNTCDTNVQFTLSPEAARAMEPFVVSTRMRGARNVAGFALAPTISRAERERLEAELRASFESFYSFDSEASRMNPGTGLSGQYHSLAALEPGNAQLLRDKGVLFSDPSPKSLMTVSGCARDWPLNRGIFLNAEKTIVCWTNEEDHCRLISMQDGYDVATVFKRYLRLCTAFDGALKARGHRIMQHDRLGFLTTCPSNIGTALRVSMKVRLPHFAAPAHSHLLEELCGQMGLQARGSNGEHTMVRDSTYDISNKGRIGESEVKIVQRVVLGVLKLIELEQRLQKQCHIAMV